MSNREWRFYLNDMIAFAEKVLDYTGGYDQERFEADGKVLSPLEQCPGPGTCINPGLHGPLPVRSNG